MLSARLPPAPRGLEEPVWPVRGESTTAKVTIFVYYSPIRRITVPARSSATLPAGTHTKGYTMTNNDLLRRLRYALNLNGETIAEMCTLGGHGLSPLEVLKLLKKEEEPGFVACSDIVMSAFLDGLIISRRGALDPKPGSANTAGMSLNNNIILRKIRIALELNDEAMLAVLGKAGVQVSKSELSAMFRAAGHRNYKPCGDQFLRNFIRGLTLGGGKTLSD
jgi:uncharacterized protein YehS (DUF1456 family)